jgi:hypothetical protein
VKGRSRYYGINIGFMGSWSEKIPIMELLATFASQFWTCLKIIWVDSTFVGKEFMEKIEKEFSWKLEHLNC